MYGKKGNSLVVIENGKLTMYPLDDRLTWEIGRPSKDCHPDIKLYSGTVSRRHGVFQNMDGIWFYLDHNGKNGTVYNQTHIVTGLKGRVKPVMLSDGDIFIFGGGKEPIVNHKTIWAMYMACSFDEVWSVVDTKGMDPWVIRDGNRTMVYKQPQKGAVVRTDSGIAIYMGDVTYLAGSLCVGEK